MFFLFVRSGHPFSHLTRSSNARAGDPSSGHSSPILCASFSPTGNLLATGSGDASARLWDLFTETPSHTLSGHKDWVLCVEWEALERKLATGGHDSHVSFWRARYFSNVGRHLMLEGPNMGSQKRKAYRRRAERTHKMDHVFILGTNTHVGGWSSSVATLSAGC
jgi:WD40 repeat protein